jgi:glycine cleavage system aminomethyltransferase T
MKHKNYADAYGTLRISAKRFEPSPYTEKYASEDMIFGVYCRRFYPLSIAEDPIEQYWKLRRGVMLFDVPEKPLEIKGPDVVALLERVFTRRIDDLKTWRARYAVACTPQGGILMDGVLIRLAQDHFWYVMADGEFESWLPAHSQGLEVTIRDPRSRVIQIQGPKSLEVLQAATKGSVLEGFGYFHAGIFDFDGQELLVTRTGWTGEMGVEIYSDGAKTDHHALWDHLMAAGESFGMEFSGAEAMGIRRIEAGILDNGTDIDLSMTPYEAGIGAFVDLDKPDFVGRDALIKADQSCLLLGLTCAEAVPLAGLQVFDGESIVGHMTTGAWTPYLETGIGFVRFYQKGDWLGRRLTLCTAEGDHHDCEIASLPFYDAEKKIPRGLEFRS